MYYLMAQTMSILVYYQYSGAFSVETWVFDPPGCPFLGFPTTRMQLTKLKKYHQGLS